MAGVGCRLDLESGVSDLDVPGQAVPQCVEELAPCPVGKQRSSAPVGTRGAAPSGPLRPPGRSWWGAGGRTSRPRDARPSRQVEPGQFGTAERPDETHHDKCPVPRGADCCGPRPGLHRSDNSFQPGEEQPRGTAWWGGAGTPHAGENRPDPRVSPGGGWRELDWRATFLGRSVEKTISYSNSDENSTVIHSRFHAVAHGDRCARFAQSHRPGDRCCPGWRTGHPDRPR